MKSQISNHKSQITNRINWKLAIGYLVLVLILAPSASAQVRTFTISPPTIEANLDPGARSEGILKVINDSDEPLQFNVTTQDFIVNDTNGTPTLLEPDDLSEKYSASNWIAVYPSTFTVEPRKRIELNYYIQVPANAGAGGHYAAVVYKPVNQDDVDGSGAAVSTQIGSLFYVGVNGDIKESATVSKFEANKFQEYGPIKLSTQITNDGDLHIKPEGSISLFNLIGQRSQIKGLDERNIFPGGGIREFETELGGKIMIGRYKASLLANYGVNKNLPLSATTTFWVFPWKLAILVILLTIAAILGYLYFKRRGKKNKDQENNTNAPSSPTQEPTEA